MLNVIFVCHCSVAIPYTRAELCSGDIGFAQAEMPVFLCIARALDRGQLSGKKTTGLHQHLPTINPSTC